MNQSAKPVDSVQQRIVEYACHLDYDALSPQAIQAAKVRVVDTLGALIGGFSGEPARLARNFAAATPHPDGATIIGTKMKATPEIAAFVNSTTARYVEMTDNYHWPGSSHGHPSDTLTPVLAVAEHVHATGREFITAVVLAYEVFLRISDVTRSEGFHPFTNLATIGTAVGAGKLLGLSPKQLGQCISLAVVPNNMLRQVAKDGKTMFASVAAGHGARAGVFAAMLARADIEGPNLPFEGQCGWNKYVINGGFSLDVFGGKDVPFKILDTQIKMRPAAGGAIASILATEKIAPLKDIKDVKQVTVEVSKFAKGQMGPAESAWNPVSKETADHSIPFNVAAVLMDGTVTLRSYSDAYLRNSELHALVQKIEIIENDEFTQAFEKVPVAHCSRVSVVMNSGERLVGESGGDGDAPSTPKSNAQIATKFRGLTEDVLGAQKVNAILDQLWRLEDHDNVAGVPQLFVID